MHAQPPTMPRLDLDRRTQRESEPLAALGVFLDRNRRRLGVRALAVADSTGVLVQGAGSFRDCEEMVALAAVDEPMLPNPQVCPLRVHGVQALLCSSDDIVSAELSPLAEGCTRILGDLGNRR